MELKSDMNEIRKKKPKFFFFIPPFLAFIYPFFLIAFHSLVGEPGDKIPILNATMATIIMGLIFSIPFCCLIVANKKNLSVSFRRLAFASVLSPTIFVFLGVIQALINSKVSDLTVWCIGWIFFTLLTNRSHLKSERPLPPKNLGRLRIFHGVTALILCIFILFHLTNHLLGLIGPEEHEKFMNIGRIVYRSTVVEPILVIAMIVQIVIGLKLSWQWSAARPNFYRTFQIGSGVYLSVFILGHMNSVFIYARTYLKIPTDWNFAIGAPTGLIHDAWNIRLLPHYALGVFFVLGHLCSGLRVVLNAHATITNYHKINALWFSGLAFSLFIAIAIISGMCGIRI